MSCERCEVATGVRTHRESECSGVVRVHRQHRVLMDSSRPGMGYEADPCVDAPSSRSLSMPPALSGEGNTLARTSEGLEASTGSSKASSSSLRTPSRSLGPWATPRARAVAAASASPGMTESGSMHAALLGAISTFAVSSRDKWHA
ncbi:unnamed protein product [Peronospora farinosa]|uniref:Uncharacterized protein n=1 Tax=Peronospora farinosa TaxID=134698 RepID=A0AAV0U826_9STRA|nr:unnamed protein product [Peronospora farinosa]